MVDVVGDEVGDEVGDDVGLAVGRLANLSGLFVGVACVENDLPLAPVTAKLEVITGDNGSYGGPAKRANSILNVIYVTPYLAV